MFESIGENILLLWRTVSSFSQLFRQRRKVIGEVVVRIGENKNPERFWGHPCHPVRSEALCNTQVTLLPGLTDLLFTPVSFNNFGLSPEVVRGTQAMGFSEPTPIQLRAFPIILSGKDLIGTAQTGTGKTAAFALPIMTLLAKQGVFRCLVLEPTRELAAQVETAFRDYGRFTDLRVSVVHGGVGYIRDLSVTGLTSNPSIFDKAISGGDAYNEQIAEVAPKAAAGEGVGANENEKIFFELALADLRDACDLFADVHRRTAGVDGFCSLEVSPLIADDAAATIEEAKALHAKGERDNLYIKIPGTEAGREAIEESIFAGIPINVTLLFDDKQYLGAADAYMRGIERRIEAGLDPNVASVASLFISRWDVAVGKEVPDNLVNRLGIAVGGRAFRAYNELLDSDRMRRSGLVVPAGTHDPPPQQGIVLAVGPGLDWWEQAGVEMPVQPGDHVVFPASAGVWVEVDEERLLVCRVVELLGILESARAEPEKG